MLSMMHEVSLLGHKTYVYSHMRQPPIKTHKLRVYVYWFRVLILILLLLEASPDYYGAAPRGRRDYYYYYQSGSASFALGRSH